MDKKRLGQTDLYVSPLGLGTVKFGRDEQVKYPEKFKIPDEPQLAALLSLAHELGVNVLDTAPSYGLSEERLGRLLKHQRKDWIIIGKAGEDFKNGRSTYDFTADHFERSLHQSLKKLDTDYLDMLLIHSDGADLKILSDDTLIQKMLDFKTRGLVRCIGASTKTLDGGLKALDLLDIVMTVYTPLQTTEKPVLDRALQLSKGIILKKSLLSGHINRLNSTQPVQDSMDFAFSHAAVNCVITGTINPGHLAENIKSATRASSSASSSREFS